MPAGNSSSKRRKPGSSRRRPPWKRHRRGRSPGSKPERLMLTGENGQREWLLGECRKAGLDRPARIFQNPGSDIEFCEWASPSRGVVRVASMGLTRDHGMQFQLTITSVDRDLPMRVEHGGLSRVIETLMHHGFAPEETQHEWFNTRRARQQSGQRRAD